MRLFLRVVLALILAVVVALLLLRGLAATREQADRDATLPAGGHLVATDFGRIHVIEAGPAKGPVALLIHGSVGWAGLWADTQADLAAAGWRSVAIDLPPMGWSDRDPRAAYDRETQALRIRAVAGALNIRPVIVAHSFGAGPGAEAIMQDPAAFAGLVVVNGAIGLGSDGTGARLPAPMRPRWLREIAVSASVTNPWATGPLLRLFLHRKEMATPEVLAVLNAPFRLRGSTAAVADWVPSLLIPPVGTLSTTPDGWRALSGRVAFIWGDRDTATPPAQGLALADLTGGRMFMLPEVGHIPQIEDPAAFHAALRQALAGFRD